MRAPKLAGLVAVRVLMTAAMLVGMEASGRSAGPRVEEAEAKIAAGDELSSKGQFQEAYERWRESEREFSRAKNVDGQIRSLLRQARACDALGQRRLALVALNAADVLAAGAGDAPAITELKAARGAMNIFSREAGDAEALLRESLQAARLSRNRALVASILNDLGILLAAQQKGADARQAFEEAVGCGDPELVAKVRKNMADEALASGDYARAERQAGQAGKAAGTLPDGHEKIFLLVGTARLLQRVFVEGPEHNNELRTQAFALNQAAARIAEKMGDARGQAYALGEQGALYEFEKRYEEALALTRRAVFAAQQAHSPDALYRWEWQTGRLLARQGQRELAIQSYRRAIGTLQLIRNDIAIRRSNLHARSSFRDAAGAVYLELADLLLQRADRPANEAEVQTLLTEARDTAELLKVAELEDYFQDGCVNLLRSKVRKVENISAAAAVVYFLPLPDRTELLVSLPAGKLERFKVAVPDEQLADAVRLFRQNLEDRSTDSYLEQGQQLYTWLIKPLEPLLARGGFDTLVFVPDGALRTVPMAALHDGQKFLIEKYAVAVTPGLELMEAKPAERGHPKVMIRGLSEARDGFPPLPYVPQEVADIGRIYQGSDSATDAEFKHAATGDRLLAQPFTIVHIASHGHFDSDVRKSFVLAYDERMTLDDLERYIRPAQLRDHPLELLTLSACQTAAGDDRAALGLAGIAVKAGARSAFATLWSVNDAATATLVGDFYQELANHPEKNKAQALQTAQKRLLAQSRYAHPCYWAPYLMIGNWL